MIRCPDCGSIFVGTEQKSCNFTDNNNWIHCSNCDVGQHKKYWEKAASEFVIAFSERQDISKDGIALAIVSGIPRAPNPANLTFCDYF